MVNVIKHLVQQNKFLDMHIVFIWWFCGQGKLYKAYAKLAFIGGGLCSSNVCKLLPNSQVTFSHLYESMVFGGATSSKVRPAPRQLLRAAG
ncbi:hypothetical protein OK016_02580 [Vibrio chagasii]|nr:hypothetical protein [Vibrio chagasii]